ncbi:MAG: IPT/TIG domain-containing protein [Thermoanaerobaculia bacterium]
MRPTLALALSLLFIPALSAQQLHQATPVEELLAQIHAAQPAGHDHQQMQQHLLIAEMMPLPAVSAAVGPAATKAFTVTAQRFAFTVSPSPFVVNQGDTVTLDITSTDVQHGFFLEQYFENFSFFINQGQHRTVSFVASTPGSFTFACTQSGCGEGHPNMFGTMTVQAAPSPPAITSFDPTTGPTSGGTVVAITGTNFQNGATVTFGDKSAVSVTFNNANSLSVISPAHDAGDVSLIVSNPDGQSVTSAGVFTYAVPGPSISSITPDTGSTAGGTEITISGGSFAAGATVTFGGVAAANVNVVNATTITATTPPGPVNIATTASSDVVVRNTDGRSATRTGGFTYAVPPPAIVSLAPQGALPAGGGTVTINGAGFTTALPISVTFGGETGTNVQVLSPTLLTDVAPAHAPGVVDVVVSVGTARATAASAFSYQQSAKKRRAVKRQ